MHNNKKWVWGGIFFFVFLAGFPLFAKQIAKPYWSLGAIKAATLTLKNGNLDCSPYDCVISLKPNQKFTKIKPHIFALWDHGKIIQYYFYSSDFVKIPGYSGDPINLELSITPDKRIKFTRLISLNEPIFIEGIPVSDLSNSLKKFRGFPLDNIRSLRKENAQGKHFGKKKNFRKHPHQGRRGRGAMPKGIIITGATVTARVMGQTVITSSTIVGQQVGIIPKANVRKIKISQKFQPMSWQALYKLGAIGRLKIMPQEMGLPKSNTPWLDVYFANVSIPIIGRNLLGDDVYFSLKKALKPHESLILVINNGTWSFKGSAFARGGIFDRFSLKQNFNIYTFRDTDYLVLYGSLKTKGAPSYTESGMFKVSNPTFQVGKTWQFVVMGSRLTGKTAVSKKYKQFMVNYTLPPSFYTVVHSSLLQQQSQKLSFIASLWADHWMAVTWYIFLWLFVIGIFTFKGYLSRSKKIIDAIHFGVLATTFITVGLYQHGQPSSVNITTFVNVIIHQNSWNIYLRDPFLFVGWILIVISILFWGRTLFCGWICPFGALQEMIFRIRTWITPFKKSYDFKPKYQKNLKYLSYVIFLVIFILSLFSFQMSEIVIDKIEPFKTIWNVGILNRPIGYGLYIAILLSLGVFSYRFFCRYLCPLGGGLAFLSLIPLWRIKRRNTCTACTICAKSCPALAITKKGKVDMKNCFGYFACITNMYDKKKCPPMISKKLWDKNKEKDIKFP